MAPLRVVTFCSFVPPAGRHWSRLFWHVQSMPGQWDQGPGERAGPKTRMECELTGGPITATGHFLKILSKLMRKNLPKYSCHDHKWYEGLETHFLIFYTSLKPCFNGVTVFPFKTSRFNDPKNRN